MRVTIGKKCPECGKKSHVRVDVDGLRRWEEGELIQRALPDLDANEREVLMTGLCAACWGAMWTEDDDV